MADQQAYSRSDSRAKRRHIEESEDESDGESLGGMSADALDAAVEQEGASDEEEIYPVLSDEEDDEEPRTYRADRRESIIDRILHEERAGTVERYPPIAVARAEVADRHPWPLGGTPAFLNCAQFTVNGLENAPPGFRFRETARVNTTINKPIDAPTVGEDDRNIDADQYEEISPAYSEDHKGSARGFRRFVGTLNNPSVAELQALLVTLRGSLWGVIGLEVGESGTSHLQFTARFKDAKTRSAWSKAVPHAWIAPCRGTEEHCDKYCKKGGHWIEVNRSNYSPGQGARMDLEAAAIAVRDQGSVGLASVIRECPQTFVRFHAGLQALVRLTGSTRSLLTPPKVHWYIGESGSGKSHAAESSCRALAGDQPVYHLNVSTYKWVSNYRGQKFIMIHDFRGSNGSGQAIPLNHWLGMFDKFAYDFEEKGGMVPCMAETFFVSSIHHPNSGHEYKDSIREPIMQLLRRITDVFECKRNGPVGSSDPTHYSCVRIGNGCDTYPLPLLQPLVPTAI